jgi:hypothetical protein
MSGQSDHGREHAPDAQPHDRSQAGGSTPELRGGPRVWLGKLLVHVGAQVWTLRGWRSRVGMRVINAGLALLKARRP